MLVLLLPKSSATLYIYNIDVLLCMSCYLCVGISRYVLRGQCYGACAWYLPGHMKGKQGWVMHAAARM